MERSSDELRCLIAAGGTAGHVLPALAIADALRQRGVHVTFAGSPDRVEAQLVPEAGYELDTFRVSGLPRRPGVALARALLARAGARRSRAGGSSRGAGRDVVLGGGGYVAGPMVLAAAARRHPGRAHRGRRPPRPREPARRAVRPARLPRLPASRARRAEVPRHRPADPGRARGRCRAPRRARRFGLPPEGPVLLVFGGSQGARALNEVAVEAFGESGPAVLHLCGERDYAALRDRVAPAGLPPAPFTDDVGAALAAADLALARAGGSVWELAAAGVPAVLVPSPNVTADHQTEERALLRARRRRRRRSASPSSARAPAVVRSLLDDPRRLARDGAAMLALARPDAADEIAEELIALAR